MTFAKVACEACGSTSKPVQMCQRLNPRNWQTMEKRLCPTCRTKFRYKPVDYTRTHTGRGEVRAPHSM
jgi:hypothetical protein